MANWIHPIHTVKNQFQISNDITRQCSWFSHLICNEIDALLDNFNNNENFTNIYHNILNNATEKKSKSEFNDQIETLFSKQILEVSKFNWTFYKCIVNQDVEDILRMTTNYNNYEKIKNFKLNLPSLSIDELINKILKIEDGNPIIINRYFMSFVLVKNKNNFIIFDSHYNISGYINKNDILKYVIFDDYSQNIITIGFINIIKN